MALQAEKVYARLSFGQYAGRESQREREREREGERERERERERGRERERERKSVSVSVSVCEAGEQIPVDELQLGCRFRGEGFGYEGVSGYTNSPQT